jgi:SAM-dependent methyltransferase
MDPDKGLAFTGERFMPGLPDADPRLRAEHVLRYAAACRLIRGGRVLDMACGEGYGAAMLAEVAAEVVGLDISEEAIAHATNAYRHVPHLSFGTASAASLPHDEESFDAVVSFETIEHLTEADQARFVKEVRRVLRPGGLFIASTPNRSNYAESRTEFNPFHLRELDEREFVALLEPFKIFAVYRQSVMAFPAIWSSVDKLYAMLSDLSPNPLDDTYLIAVAGREAAERPQASLASLWYEPGLSFAALQRTYSEWGRSANATIHERDELARRLQQQFEERTAWALRLDNELVERAALLAERDVQRPRALGHQGVANLACFGPRPPFVARGQAETELSGGSVRRRKPLLVADSSPIAGLAQ